MVFVIFQQHGAWRWLLRNGVEIVAKGRVFASQERATFDAEQFKKKIANAQLEVRHGG